LSIVDDKHTFEKERFTKVVNEILELKLVMNEVTSQLYYGKKTVLKLKSIFFC